MDKPYIALLSDFGKDSFYVGIMKAVILKICSQVHIIDITHSIEPQNVKQASFILANSIDYFPQGTIFCSVVDPEVGSNRKAIAIKTERYTFVCPDNGILSYYLKENRAELAINLTNRNYQLENRSYTFDGRDLFAPASAYLAKGEDIHSLGEAINIKDLKKLPDLICYEKENGVIEAEILCSDSFGNLITSIPKSIIKSKDCQILCENVTIKGISKTYSEVPNKDFVAYIGSMGYLEIGIRNGNAKDYFGKSQPSRIFLTNANL